MILQSKNIMPFVWVLAGSVVLAACSSKPSPWSDEASSSPWDNRAAEQSTEPEPLVLEPVEPVGAGSDAMMSDPIEPVIAEEEEVIDAESIEPMGLDAMENEAISEQSGEMIMDEAPVMVAGSLAEQPDNFFAVQVVASSSMDNLKAFAQEHQMSDEWVAETSVDGKLWYVLMKGVYPSKAEAEQALESVQGIDTQPWIRTVGSIKSVMN